MVFSGWIGADSEVKSGELCIVGRHDAHCAEECIQDTSETSDSNF